MNLLNLGHLNHLVSIRYWVGGVLANFVCTFIGRMTQKQLHNIRFAPNLTLI